ncbi:MAG: histidine-type phosphatase [Bacteroidales bacterium]|nr:histidine-type phosphatase [Bacteroidales bacterium]
MRRFLLPLLLSLCACLPLRAEAVTDTLTLEQLRTILREHPAKAGGTKDMYVFGPYRTAPAPKGYEPVYISHYGRHGARYVTRAAKYDTLRDLLEKAREKGVLTEKGQQLHDSYMAAYPRLKGHEGDLTDKGEAQHRELARRMMKAYPSVFKKGHVDARASVSHRAVVSMMSFCDELHLRNPRLEIDYAADYSDLPFTVLKTGTFPATEDLYALMQDPEFARKYQAALQALTVDTDAILGRLFTDTRFVEEIGRPADVVSLLSEVETNLPCLDFDVSFPELFTDEERFRLWEAGNYTGVMMFVQNPYSKGIIPAYSWPLLENILQRAEEDLASGDVDVRLRFGHDTIVGPVMGLLGIDGWGDAGADLSCWKYRFQSWNIPMASNLQFIFYRSRRNPSDILVRMMYNEKDQILPLRDQSRAPYYRWDDVKAHYTEVCREAKETLERLSKAPASTAETPDMQ